MSLRLILAVIGATACFLSGCETTTSTGSSLPEAEYRRLATETCALINASSATWQRVSAIKRPEYASARAQLAGVSTGDFSGDVHTETVRLTAHAEFDGDETLSVKTASTLIRESKTTERKGGPVKRTRYSCQYESISSIPIRRVARVTITRYSFASWDSGIDGNASAGEVTNDCYRVVVESPRKFRYHLSAKPSTGESNSFEGKLPIADIAYFDKHADAERLAANLRKLAGID